VPHFPRVLCAGKPALSAVEGWGFSFYTVTTPGAPFLARFLREKWGFLFTMSQHLGTPVETSHSNRSKKIKVKGPASRKNREKWGTRSGLILTIAGKPATRRALWLHRQDGVEIVVDPVAGIRREDGHVRVDRNDEIGRVNRRGISGGNCDAGIAR